jgi:hypothetical protein
MENGLSNINYNLIYNDSRAKFKISAGLQVKVEVEILTYYKSNHANGLATLPHPQ